MNLFYFHEKTETENVLELELRVITGHVKVKLYHISSFIVPFFPINSHFVSSFPGTVFLYNQDKAVTEESRNDELINENKMYCRRNSLN